MMPSVRSLLVLRRFGPLPTIWSNCLAGWWLGGEGDLRSLPFLFGGATLLFLGGACLSGMGERPFEGGPRGFLMVPPGTSQSRPPWVWCLGAIITGELLLCWLGAASGALGLTLGLLLLGAGFGNRLGVLAPVWEGLTRFFLYVLGASTAAQGVTGEAIWCGLALWAYVAGVGYLELRTASRKPYWPLVLLAVPILLALVMDTGPFREASWLLSGLSVLWVLRCLRPILWPSEPAERRTALELLAGIVLVDWLAACPAASLDTSLSAAARQISFGFIALFLLALVFERLGHER